MPGPKPSCIGRCKALLCVTDGDIPETMDAAGSDVLLLLEEPESGIAAQLLDPFM